MSAKHIQEDEKYGDEKEERKLNLPTSSFVNYDDMTDEEYYAEMERKVEFYKQNFPDMYAKAEKWLEMMNQSQIYQANAPNDQDTIKPEEEKAKDILKNALFNGWLADDLLDNQRELLSKWIPNWEEQLVNNQ